MAKHLENSVALFRGLNLINPTTIFASPGTRSLPLVSALHLRESRVVSVIDERSAAFCALGFSKSNLRPAVAICTSGTAVAHFFPAIIEAHQSKIPIIAISADRPIDLVGSGSNQTINQQNIFGKYAHFVQIDGSNEEPSTIESKVRAATDQSMLSGVPLHINISFGEPLLSETERSLLKAKVEPSFDSLNKTARTNFNLQPKKSQPDLSDTPPTMTSLADEAITGEMQHPKAVVVVGRLNKAEAKFVGDWLQTVKIPFICDLTSGLHWVTGERKIPSFENMHTLQALTNSDVETVVHIGGHVVSKNYLRFLSQFTGTITQYASATGPFDPLKRVTKKYALTKLARVNYPEWEAGKLLNVPDDTSETSLLNTKTVCAKVLQKHGNILVGNSSVIRCADLCSSSKNTRIFTQRGASGIDGLVATGFGIAVNEAEPTYVVLGDISTLHDLGSLALLSMNLVNLTVIICNNFGGSIFDKIETAKLPEINRKYIKTPHSFEFELAAKFFNIPYARVTSPTELENSLMGHQGGPRLIECIIEPENELTINAARKERLK